MHDIVKKRRPLNEAPRSVDRGIFSHLLRLFSGKVGRERNPSEAKSDLAKGDKKPVLFLVILVFLLTLFVIVFKKITYKNSKVYTIDTKSSIKTSSIDGESFVANIPDDLPIYPDSTLKEFSNSEANNNSTITMVFETVANSGMVDKYFEENLKNNSWDINQRFEKDGSYTLSFIKGARRGIIGIADGEGGNVIILVTVDK